MLTEDFFLSFTYELGVGYLLKDYVQEIMEHG
jgi:hypothetical protein